MLPLNSATNREPTPTPNLRAGRGIGRLRSWWRWLALGLAGCWSITWAGCEPPVSIPQGVQVYFSPRGGATEAVVKALQQATNTVLVQAYSFTSAPIARGLVDAEHRGCKVRVILDKSQRTEKYSEADFLANEGVPTSIDAQHAIAHNKIIIIDDYVVLTGSFNFTRAAEEHNAENLLVVNDPVLAKQYRANWETHAAHAEPFGRPTRPAPPRR